MGAIVDGFLLRRVYPTKKFAITHTGNHRGIFVIQMGTTKGIEEILWSGVQEAMTGKYTPKEDLLLMEKKYARF